MSRLPPLPPGLPPKPSVSGQQYNDSYRRGVVQNETHHINRERDWDREPMYKFGANNSYGSGRRSPPRYNYNYGPGNAPPPLRPARDVYRSQQDGGNAFTFRYNAPPSIAPRQDDNYRPRSPHRDRTYNQENRNGYRQSHNHGAARGGYRGRFGPRMASDREFLKGNRAPTPEQMFGMDEDGLVRYKPIDDVSDSDEGKMDVYDNENDDVQQPKKKLRTSSEAADGDSVPRWSNPDPYTALPPPDDSQRKKKDVVKLIRKARVDTSSGGTSKLEAAADDFISFDFGGESNEEDDEYPTDKLSNGVAGAPTGPRFSHRNNLQNQQAPVGEAVSLQTAPGNRPAKSIDTSSDPSLGNRKRDIRDQIKELKPPPLVHKMTKGKPGKANGAILKEWQVKAGTASTPWLEIDHSGTAKMGVWLHKEIVDFYNYVKPRSFENLIRSKLVEDLRSRVRQNYGEVDIRTFGSFPAGLYLPTADMDLVCVSDEFMRGGPPLLGQTNSAIRRFSEFIRRQDLAIEGSVDMIFGAKVPLVKYIDKITGLKVDISFENKTGLVANQTFLNWSSQFPAMPTLVTLIKHLLAMRGLNEPVNGGIGGFSVTCLVVSLLQNMPQVQSRSMTPEHHLGEILMEFFDLYGNQFNTRTTAIQFDPPGYVSKASTRAFVYKANNADRLSIIDPNNSQNDISGGSGNTQTILKCFSQTYRDLQKRMGDLQYSSDRRNQSILGCALAGNYRSFKLQREHLAHVHEKLYGPIEAT